MIFTINFSSIENVNNDIQISIAENCEPGQKIVTETLNERPRDKDGNSLFTVHPTHSWLEKSSDNYYPMKGTLKVWFRWKEGDAFQAEPLGFLPCFSFFPKNEEADIARQKDREPKGLFRAVASAFQGLGAQ